MHRAELPNGCRSGSTQPKANLDDKWLEGFYGARPKALARRYAPEYTYAEAFEISEYGRRMPASEIQQRLQAPRMA